MNCIQFSLLILLLSASSLETRNVDKIRLDPDGNFIDTAGHTLVFHGFNSVLKRPPWYPEQMLNRTRLALYQKWGINVVRLGVMWSGVMPSRGQVDHAYLGKIREIVDACDEFGIYVLFDMHQDVLSSLFDGYDGIPLWLAKDISHPPESFEYPWPFTKPPANWFGNYLTYACADCAENLYKNDSGAVSYWGDFWATLAQEFSGHANVIGYELINEPAPANFYKNPLHALPGYVGRNFLLPAYDYLVKRIRKFDNDTLIFYEPLIYGVFLPASPLQTGTGFDRVPGALVNPAERNKAVLSYHYYCWLIQTADASRDMKFIEKIACDNILLPSVLKNTADSIKRSGGARFLTEFGLCAPDGNPNSINTIECNKVLQLADKNVQSWMYWDGDFINRDGHPVTNQLLSFSRAYPLRILGTELKYTFDTVSGYFDFEFKFSSKDYDKTEDLLISEVYLPMAVHYPNGVDVQSEPSAVKQGLDGNLLRLHLPSGLQLSETMVITLHVRSATRSSLYVN